MACPGMDSANRDDVACPGGHSDRFGSHAHAGHQPGGAQLWVALCSHPINLIHLSAKDHEGIGKHESHHRSCEPGSRIDCCLEYLFARANLFGKMI